MFKLSKICQELHNCGASFNWKRQYLLPGTALTLLFTASGGNAHAQEQSSATSEGNITEVIEVTARRKGESIQDVPQTVDAVNAEMMEKLNLTEFEDIESVVPGLTLNNEADRASSTAALRGVASAGETGASPTVEFYINDTPMQSDAAFLAMFDVGQIEVLSGPQGTLRGKSSPSGAITITTRKPDLYESTGYINSSISNQDSRIFQGAYSTPIIEDKLGIRVAGMYNESDANGVLSVHNPEKPFNETKAIRASLLYVPNDDLTVNFTYQNIQVDSLLYYQVYGTGNTVEINGEMVTNGPEIFAGQRMSVSDGGKELEQSNEIAILNIDWSIGNNTLSYIGSYSENNTVSLLGQDRAHWFENTDIFRNLESEGSRLIHEIRLSSDEKIAGKLSYTIGFLSLNSEGDSEVYIPSRVLTGALGSPLGEQGLDFNKRFVVPITVEAGGPTDEMSVFATMSYDLNEATEFTVGARYMHVEQVRNNLLTLGDAYVAAVLPESLCVPTGIPSFGIPPGEWQATYDGVCDLVATSSATLQDLNDEVDETQLIYNASLSHRIDEDLMVYATTGTSWRAGPTIVGITAQLDEELENLVFLEPEKSTSYELGFKSQWFDDRVQLNAALYHQLFDNYIYYGESTYYLSISDSPVVNDFAFTANVDAVVSGIDIDTSIAITENWRADIGLSYSSSNIDDDEIPCNDSDFDGIPDDGMPTAEDFIAAGRTIAMCQSDSSISTFPDFKMTLMSEYFFGVNDSVEGYLRALYTYRGTNKNANYQTDAYGLLNLYTGVRDLYGDWEVGLFAKNILDKQMILNAETDIQINANLSGYGDSGYYSIRSYTPRREIGVSVRYSF